MVTSKSSMTRAQVLRAGSGTAAAAGLAACGVSQAPVRAKGPVTVTYMSGLPETHPTGAARLAPRRAAPRQAHPDLGTRMSNAVIPALAPLPPTIWLRRPSKSLPFPLGKPNCRLFSRAYLRHLFASRELLAYRLLTLHNLTFYHGILTGARRAISEGRFSSFRSRLLERYGVESVGGSDPISTATEA